MPFDVLVVDDDARIRQLFSTVLEKGGYRTKSVSSGEEAIAILENDVFRLILLDLRMPGLGGTQTLRAVRMAHPEIPVYIVSAFQEEYLEELQEMQAEGIDFQLLKKPIGGEQLRTVVEQVLGGTGGAGRAGIQLRLYIAGRSGGSGDLVGRLHEVFRASLEGDYTMEVIDILENPAAAEENGIIATPCLVRIFPEPAVRVLGNFDKEGRVLAHLGLRGL